jgi:filamentous hemagglutinin
LAAELRIENAEPDWLVWLEEGNERAGLEHLLIDKRVADFARHGIGRDEIVDAVFDALANGTPIGISGKDRVVYALTYNGRPVRIAISVGSNGFIVGANPFSLDQKAKPLP